MEPTPSPPGGPPPATYATDHAAWRAVQPLLPESMRVLGHEPDEEGWWWRDVHVHLDRYRRPDARATVIVLHGGGGHGRLLASAGRIVADAGYEAVMPDLPGYGLTDAPAARCRYDDWVALVADLVRAERARHDRPVLLLGMSVGGLLGWHAAATLPPATVAGVVATTLLDPRAPAARAVMGRWAWQGRSAALPGLAPRVLDRLRVPLAAVANTTAIANDRDVVRALRADHRGTGSSIRLGFLRSYLSYVPAVEPEDWRHAPVLLAHPGDDRWTPTAVSRAFLDRIAGPTRFVELERCGHLPMEEPGATRFADEVRRFVAAVI
ncbi:MAG: alpha/beta fold hydrolase [Solirubrobacteraceae bacterium]|nr:alpha/beta fold hydrolase [Solirubrobacteraceae bacterium]